MKYYSQLLRHPFLRIGITPFASVLFGTLVGIAQASTINWWAILTLYLLMISTQLLDHYFFLQLQHPNRHRNQSLHWVLEAIIALSVIAFCWTHHWGVNSLVLLYVAYIHLQYYPYDLTHTVYQIILQTFFYGFILSCIGYFSQVGTIKSSFMLATIPLVLVQFAFALETQQLRGQLLGYRPALPMLIGRWAFPLALGSGILLNFVLSLPSQSFFIVQILMTALSLFTIAPFVVQSHNEHQIQNKLNYLSAAYFILNLAFALSFIF